ncbi:hypothetical protein LshimejAT787_0211230 [Lyophyllum shimeji]|uniref:Uncharacterized protein n=1 Tax=Lyophyllum shimeji TaxID=47721 RepID=A0A9P3UJC3_LYOSH|nr:hypothetical protein LshimejAT787_0211230 [Lyophyllum shimeji]
MLATVKAVLEYLAAQWREHPMEQVGEELFQLLYQHFEAMPEHATPEVIWKMMAELSNKIMGVYKLLTRIAEGVPPHVSYPGTAGNVDKDDALIQSKRMLTSLVHRIKAVRNVAFSSACRDLPPPVKNTDPKSARRVLHEMLFVATDCFVELGLVQPGKHGRIFIFREELKDWLISAIEPFHVVYQDRNGTRTQYGVYKAMLLPGADMIGPEFVQLSDSTREIIITHISRSYRGSESYEAVYQHLVLSLKALPCILLQCVQLPPGTYQNSVAHSTNTLSNSIKIQPQSTRRPSPRPPGLPVPPVLILKRGSNPASASLVNNNSAQTSDDARASSGGPEAQPYADFLSLAPTSRAVPSEIIDSQHAKHCQPTGKPSKPFGPEVKVDTTSKARAPAPSSRALVQAVTPYSGSGDRQTAVRPNTSATATSFFFQDRWHHVGLSKNTAEGAPSAYQNWQLDNSHQNLILSAEAQPQIVPPCLEPMPLQSGARTNQQYAPQTNRHSNSRFAHKNTPDSLLTQTQLPVAGALYRTPHTRRSDSQIRDQNVNPIWYSTAGNPQVVGTYGPHQNNGGSFFTASILQSTGHHGGGAPQNVLPPRFHTSTSYSGSKM